MSQPARPPTRQHLDSDQASSPYQSGANDADPTDSLDDTARLLMPSLGIAAAQRALIVDDDALLIERLRALMEGAGFEVLTAATGREALQVLHTDYCPIVVSDWTMPDMDGLELCRAIRGESFPGYVYVMLLTARDGQSDVVTGLDAGADDYLSKRISEAELVARLRTARRIVALEQSLREMIEEKRRQSTTDSLTGLNNRRYLTKHLARELKRVRRFGGALSILALDIDRFKSINDTYGHGVGDEVLVQFADRITTALPRDPDWCARLGGEEFVVVLPQIDLPGAMVVAEKLRQYIGEAPLFTGAGAVPVTVSIGAAALCCMSAAARSAEALLELADRALYDSKLTGRNRVTAAPLAK
ncbi:MAG TPA: diguanylate cyclase [Steroidobacteraceae bacterium]|nr:diguanylate cyclase [Steroidobacteraceae bacterium]